MVFPVSSFPGPDLSESFLLAFLRQTKDEVVITDISGQIQLLGGESRRRIGDHLPPEELRKAEVIRSSTGEHIGYLLLTPREEWAVDPLTGVADRRRLEVEFCRRCAEIPPTMRMNDPSATDSPHLYLIFIDIDRFKVVNDQFGHLAGDRLLAWFAQRLQKEFSKNDLTARYGGDVFVVLCGTLNSEQIEQKLANLRQGKRETSPCQTVSAPLPEFSYGLTSVRRGEPFAEAIDRADKALYQMKEER